MAFFLANKASASPPAKLGVGVLLLLPSDPFKLIPLSRAGSCGAGAGFRPAAGRFAGGVGFGLPPAPLAAAAGGGGGGRGAATGAETCSSTYAAGTQAEPVGVLASHQPNTISLATHTANLCPGQLTIVFFLYDLNQLSLSDCEFVLSLSGKVI